MLGAAGAVILGQHRKRLADEARMEARGLARAGLAQPRGALAAQRARHRGHARGRACRAARYRGRRGGKAARPRRRSRAFRGTAPRSRSGSPRSGRRRSRCRGASARARAMAASASAREMAALHALEDEIGAGLHREMQMRHQPRLARRSGATDSSSISSGSSEESRSRGSSGTSASTRRTSWPSVGAPGRSGP